MPRTCVLLAAHAIMWFGVVAGDSRCKATCLTSTSVPVPHDHTRDQPLFWCHLHKKNNLHHHGGQCHDYVDPDTKSKCDSFRPSFGHPILCIEVLTQAEGSGNSQKLHHVVMRSSCDDGLNIVRHTRCATKQIARLVEGVRHAHVATTLNCKIKHPNPQPKC